VLESVDVLGLSIKTFGVFFALSFLAWGALTSRRLRELGKPAEWATEMVFVAIAGGLVGARLYYLVQNSASLHGSLLSNIFGGSGLVWYGGLLGGAVAIIAWARWRGFLGLALLDMAGYGLALGYAVGRIGCQVSGDGDYGKASGLPWAMGYPHGAVPTAPGVTVQPTPIYETLSMGLVAFGLWRLRDRLRPGLVFALYLVLAGLERFLVEFARRNEVVLGGLTAPQFESLGLLVAGLIWIGVVVSRTGSLRAEGVPA